MSDGPEIFECAYCEQPLIGGFVRFWPPTNIRFAHLGNLTVHLTADEHPEHHMTNVLYIHVEDADRLATDWVASPGE